MGANRFNLAPEGQGSLAKWLAARGREVFVLELRGAGRSVELTPGSKDTSAWRYNFDSYVEKDIPALMEKIGQLTGSQEVDWVGHSMGAMILYALAGHHHGMAGGVRIRKAVAIAGPGHIGELPVRMRFMLRLGVRLPMERLPNKKWLQFLGRFYPLLTPDNEPSLGFKSNYDPGFGKQMINHIGSDLSRGLLQQVKSWVGKDGLFSADGHVNYTAALSRAVVPIRFIRASHDLIAPAASVERAYLSAGSWKDLVVIGKAHGYPCDYGHSDIVAGKNAHLHVFPHVTDWLESTGMHVADHDAHDWMRENSVEIRLNPSSNDIPGLIKRASGAVAAAR
jgi:predicted alpha/beta hydrolase